MPLFKRARKEPAIGEATFGYKTAWLAARGAVPDAVALGLGLASLEKVPWGVGLSMAYEQGVVVVRPTENWTLVIGDSLLRLESRLGPLAERVSRNLGGEVQFFLTHRVVELHAWGRANTGTITRAYQCCGDQGTIGPNEGTPTPIEIANRVAETVADWEAGELFPDEDTVMAIAADWSVDPTRLDAALASQTALLARTFTAV